MATSDSEIEAMIRQAAGSKHAKHDKRWTPALLEEAIRFALWEHAENRACYAAVVSGTA